MVLEDGNIPGGGSQEDGGAFCFMLFYLKKSEMTMNFKTPVPFKQDEQLFVGTQFPSIPIPAMQ